jgi:hypothetical protein
MNREDSILETVQELTSQGEMPSAPGLELLREIDWLVKVVQSARAVNEIVMETRESTKDVGYEAFALAHDNLRDWLDSPVARE